MWRPAPGPAILNAHFRVAPDLAAGAPPLLGLLGANAQWVFRRGDVLSVTISAAEAPEAVILNVGDTVTVKYAEGEGSILQAYSVAKAVPAA